MIQNNLIPDRGLTLLQRPFNLTGLNASLNPDNFFMKPNLNPDQSLNSDQGLNFAQETGRNLDLIEKIIAIPYILGCRRRKLKQLCKEHYH